MQKKAIISLFFFLLTAGVSSICLSQPEQIIIDDFSNGISSRWKSKSFKGETSYKARTSAPFFLTAASSNSASGLYYEIEYSPKEYPIISWSWKIEKTITKGNALLKEGDDYPARLYVIFPSIFFWKTRALNYVWANQLAEGETTPNAFTKNAVMIAVESGNQKAGYWVSEERNIVEDYKMAFGDAPPKVGSIAIMTDTDNTGETTVAYYGQIKIMKQANSLE